MCKSSLVPWNVDLSCTKAAKVLSNSFLLKAPLRRTFIYEISSNKEYSFANGLVHLAICKWRASIFLKKWLSHRIELHHRHFKIGLTTHWAVLPPNSTLVTAICECCNIIFRLRLICIYEIIIYKISKTLFFPKIKKIK